MCETASQQSWMFYNVPFHLFPLAPLKPKTLYPLVRAKGQGKIQQTHFHAIFNCPPGSFSTISLKKKTTGLSLSLWCLAKSSILISGFDLNFSGVSKSCSFRQTLLLCPTSTVDFLLNQSISRTLTKLISLRSHSHC